MTEEEEAATCLLQIDGLCLTTAMFRDWTDYLPLALILGGLLALILARRARRRDAE